MKKHRILSTVLSVFLIAAMSINVFAAQYYLEDGSILVEATKNGQTVTQNGTTTSDSDPVISNRDESSTENTITVVTEGGVTAELTIEDINVTAYDESVIDVAAGSKAEITVKGENYVASCGDGDAATIHVGSGDLTLRGSGEIYVDSSTDGAKIGSNGEEEMSGSIYITENVTVDSSDDGSVDGAAIGSGEDGDFIGKIAIDGNANVTAKSNDRGAGIGAGEDGDFRGTVTIGGNAYVRADGDDDATGIGSGDDGSFSGGSIIIEDNAIVRATGSDEGPGIGAADDTDLNGKIIIRGNADVTVGRGSDADVDLGMEGECNEATGEIIISGNARVTQDDGETLIIGGEYEDSSVKIEIGPGTILNGVSGVEILAGMAGEAVTVNGILANETVCVCFDLVYGGTSYQICPIHAGEGQVILAENAAAATQIGPLQYGVLRVLGASNPFGAEAKVIGGYAAENYRILYAFTAVFAVEDTLVNFARTTTLTVPVAELEAGFTLVRLSLDGSYQEVAYSYADGVLTFDAEQNGLYLAIAE